MAKPRIRDAKASNLFDKDICAIPYDTVFHGRIEHMSTTKSLKAFSGSVTVSDVSSIDRSFILNH